jgi:hypothetical protein
MEFKFLENNIKLKMLLIMLQKMLLNEYVNLLKIKVLILLMIQPIFHQVMLNQLIICDAKVFGRMSDSVKPYCHSLNQSKFFFPQERAKSELQLLYQTYFSRMKVRRRKSQKRNISKKILATSSSCNIVIYFSFLFCSY